MIGIKQFVYSCVLGSLVISCDTTQRVKEEIVINLQERGQLSPRPCMVFSLKK